MSLFLSLYLFIIGSSAVNSNTVDIYNTVDMHSDLSWSSKPGDNAWSEVSGGDGKGGTIRTHEICPTTSNSEEEHWLRSPFIKVQSAKRVYVEIHFSIFKCADCRETFTLYYYQAQRDISTSTFPPWNEDLYVKIDTIAADKRFDGSTKQNVVNKKTLVIGSLKREGIYLAIRDQGACMSIMKIRLFYNYCPEVSRDLVHFPRTVAGGEQASLVAVNGQCVANSVPKDNNEVNRYHCNTNGEWTVPTGSCLCDLGFQNVLGSCKACKLNTYKWNVGKGNCLKCPQYSYTKEEASSICQCVRGFYRSQTDNVTVACTKPPSAPRNLNRKIEKNSVSISWMPPKDTGGRNDIYYSVSCNTCDENFIICRKCSDSVKFIPNNVDRLDKTSIFIPNLNQSLFYEIKIFSYNGVSEKSQQIAKSAKMRFSISEAVPSAVRDVRIDGRSTNSLSLHWSKPERFKGQIHKYEIQLQPLASDGDSFEGAPLSIQVSTQNSTITGLTAATSYRVRVRALSTEGFGYSSIPQTFSTTEETKNVQIPIIVAACVGSLLFVLVVVFLLVRKRRKSVKHRVEKTRISLKPENGSSKILSNMPTEHKFNAELHGRSMRKTYVDYRDPHKGVKDIAKEIDISKIKVQSVIGQGEFGEVCRGKIVEGKNKVIDVAVKRLKDGIGIVDQTNFLKEACTMAQFNHPNIIELKGVVTKKMPAMIITEYMSNGSLDKFLQKRKGDLLLVDLLKMQRGIASGMRYLAEMKYVHRDLAARNILIDSNLCCKVSDFGLSRTLSNDPNATYTTQGGKIALKWTAPECIRYRKFTSASDVWSFGIVMWEIMSYGEKPYWDMHNDDVTDVILDGYRLTCPEECPRALHDLMLKCWSFDQHKRPTFVEIYSQLDSHVTKPSSLLINSSNDSSCDLTQPLINPDSSSSLQDVSTVDEWLEIICLGKYRRSFLANGINDLEALSKINTSDLERLGIASPEHRSRLQSGIDTLRRHIHQNTHLRRDTNSDSINLINKGSYRSPPDDPPVAIV